jgi:hypothetical protein
MSYKSENWKEKLEEVRSFVQRREGSVEKTADDILNEEIEDLLHGIGPDDEGDQEVVVEEETVESLESLKKELLEQVSVVEQKILKLTSSPVKETVEKSIEKLTEKNMLGRLAKQLQLNEEGKQKMFAYFEKGQLEQ